MKTQSDDKNAPTKTQAGKTFKVGDKVICVLENYYGIVGGWITYGKVYEVIAGDESLAFIRPNCRGTGRWYIEPEAFEVVTEVAPNTEIISTIEKQRLRGPSGAPTRATTLPTGAKERKNFPVASGVLDYFPDALVALAQISKAGNDQHNPGLPLRWDRSKSGDEADTCMRHFLQRGTLDTDGMRHTAKAAWRMLALLQKEIEAEQHE